jgi:uncharacterized protein DUF5781
MASSEEMNLTVAEARKNALERMKNAGYSIGDSIEVVIDPKLPFMGYTVPINGHYRTVVAGGAVESGMLDGLLLHEMSHIYRMQNNHPSHNPKIIEEAIKNLGAKAQSKEYQRKIIGNIVNNIEDLYADDISTKIMRANQLYQPDAVSVFLQENMVDKPVQMRDARKERWTNTGIMADNARYMGQMRRHKIEDVDGRGESANKRFLSQVSPRIAEKYQYFYDVVVNLNEDLTDEGYRKLLSEYLNTFVQVAEEN